MTPAAWPRAERRETRLLHIDRARGTCADRSAGDLPDLLRAGDLLVVNDAATLPASLRGTTHAGKVEVRLLGEASRPGEWNAILFGEGSWRERTEDRAAPPELGTGDVIAFEDRSSFEDLHAETRTNAIRESRDPLRAEVREVARLSPRLVALRFDREGASLWSALYRAGSPVQYSYLRSPLSLWHVQTAYGSRPWAMEMPSAGWCLAPSVIRELRRRGIRVSHVTHAAGLSSTGDARLDAALPLPERYDVPAETVRDIEHTRTSFGRIVAVGTTVVRALEACAEQNAGVLRAGSGVTELHVGKAFVPRLVDGLLTGIHETGTSHFDILRVFAPAELLEAAYAHAEAVGYRNHEFGDTCLVL